MLAYTYMEHGRFSLIEKPVPELKDPKDALVRVTLGSICTSDLHIKHGSVPRAVPGITVGHEMVGIVEQVGAEVTTVKPGDRVTVNVETFCGECFFCQHGYVNNCEDPDGGWALGCRIDGGQAEYVRVPHANQGLNRIPDGVTDDQALFVGDILATGFWAARISEITPEDTVLLIGAGPTGICTLLCARLKHPRRLIVCEKSEERIRFVQTHYPEVLVTTPEQCQEFVKAHSAHGGADVVIEVAGADDTFQLAWECARPNAIVTVVALYDRPQVLPLPDMYGKNLTFKTGGVDGCDCAEILRLIAEGKIDTTPLITHRFPLNEIEEAYRIFENRLDGVIKVAITEKVELYAGDTDWQRIARTKQSDFRRNCLQVGCEANSLNRQDGTKNYYGYVLQEKDARKGLNFYEGFRKEILSAIGAYRQPLWANLLRSEHIPWNLFFPMGLTSRAKEACGELLRELTGLEVKEVTCIRVEYAPSSADTTDGWRYLNDGTSFDCYIAYKDYSDAFCGIGIEVKYTEMAYKLQPGSSEYRHTREKLSEEYLCVTLQSGCYHTLSAATDEEAFPKVLIEDDYRQLWRNHMLGMSMVQHSDIRHFLSVHLYPSGNKHYEKVLPEYERLLTEKGQSTFLPLTYERLFEAMGHYVFFSCEEDSKWKEYLRDRYLY